MNRTAWTWVKPRGKVRFFSDRPRGWDWCCDILGCPCCMWDATRGGLASASEANDWARAHLTNVHGVR